MTGGQNWVGWKSGEGCTVKSRKNVKLYCRVFAINHVQWLQIENGFLHSEVANRLKMRLFKSHQFYVKSNWAEFETTKTALLCQF